jgi:hypothetical protein
MSWRAACLFVNQGGPGYLGSFPLHDGNRARDVLEGLGLGSFPHSRFATLEAGLAPPARYYCVGAYPKAFLLSGLGELYGAVEQPRRALVEQCVARFAGAEALLVEVSGTVGLAAFALYASGRRVRAFGAQEGRGVVLDEGAPLPEEAPWASADPASHAASAESRAFAVCARVLGTSLDRFEAERLSVELVRVPGAGLGGALRQLFGSR